MRHDPITISKTIGFFRLHAAKNRPIWKKIFLRYSAEIVKLRDDLEGQKNLTFSATQQMGQANRECEKAQAARLIVARQAYQLGEDRVVAEKKLAIAAAEIERLQIEKDSEKLYWRAKLEDTEKQVYVLRDILNSDAIPIRQRLALAEANLKQVIAENYSLKTRNSVLKARLLGSQYGMEALHFQRMVACMNPAPIIITAEAFHASGLGPLSKSSEKPCAHCGARSQ